MSHNFPNGRDPEEFIGPAVAQAPQAENQPNNCCYDYRRSQRFDFKNGFRCPKDECCAPGCENVTAKDVVEIFGYDPLMTYGPPKQPAPPPVIPQFVLLEHKVLRFLCYYKETVNDSADESYRVRPVEMYYYLEDDSIMIEEPKVPNSGLFQGKFLRRHRIPKNDIGETYHWKDLNVGCDLLIYGRCFRVCDCDCYTKAKAFYESEGIILNCPEVVPKDPYIDKRLISYKVKPVDSCRVPCPHGDCRQRFNKYGRKALRFYCIWDDRISPGGELRKMELGYFLADDEVEVREINETNTGGCNYNLRLQKIRLPKDWKDVPRDFPTVYMETTCKEIIEYYEPKDFYIGATINVFGRRFLIYDMDNFSKEFYRENFNVQQFTPINIEQAKPPLAKPCPAPWNGWGTPEDSMLSCLYLCPKPLRKDNVKYALFASKLLSYAALLDSTKPEDDGRKFCIKYKMVNDTISVVELEVRNSGRRGGKFLEYTRVMKPGTSPDCPEYYSFADLYIGALVEFFGHRFVVTAADMHVEEFLRCNPDCFPDFVQKNLFEFFAKEAKKPEIQTRCDPCENIPDLPVCEAPIGEGFFEHLGLSQFDTMRRQVKPCNDHPHPIPLPPISMLAYNNLHTCQEPRRFACPGDMDTFEAKEADIPTEPQKICIDPCIQNPVLLEDPQNIIPEEYYPLKEHRFDFINKPDDESEWRCGRKPELRLSYTCDPLHTKRGALTQAPYSFGSCQNCCGQNWCQCGCCAD